MQTSPPTPCSLQSSQLTVLNHYLNLDIAQVGAIPARILRFNRTTVFTDSSPNSAGSCIFCRIRMHKSNSEQGLGSGKSVPAHCIFLPDTRLSQTSPALFHVRHPESRKGKSLQGALEEIRQKLYALGAFEIALKLYTSRQLGVEKYR